MKKVKTIFSYTLYAVLVAVFLVGCSEFANNTETFVVRKVTKLDSKTFDYELKPTKGLGILFIDSENFYNVGDTLTLKPNCN